MHSLYVSKVIYLFILIPLIAGQPQTDNEYWLEPGATCSKAEGPDIECIHYSYCFPNGYKSRTKAHTEVCFHPKPVVIKCCTEDPPELTKPTIVQKPDEDMTTKEPIIIQQEEEEVKISNPFYRADLSNSTSLRACKVYYETPMQLKNKRIIEVGRRNSKARGYPYLAALGYGNETNKMWLCLGNLISENFVLATALCVFRTSLGAVKFVRLGENDARNTSDEADVRDYTVRKIYVHPLFIPSEHYHEIALVKLTTNVRITSYIKPACLPTIKYNLEQETLRTVGWKVDLKQEEWKTLYNYKVKGLSFRRCQRYYAGYEKFPKGIVEDWLICATVNELVDENCSVPAGAILEIKNDYYDFAPFPEIIGIAIFKETHCIVNSPIYIGILPYVPWIENIVWPDGV